MAAKVLSFDDILSANDTRYDEVEVWGGVVRIGSLTAGDMIEFVESNEGPAKRTAGLRLIIKSLVDADGKRIGQDSHLDGLRKKDNESTSKVIKAILKLNGLDTKKAQDEAKND
jgi:hypothetical protein